MRTTGKIMMVAVSPAPALPSRATRRASGKLIT